jgi:PST family polysaccharide transporter
MIQRLNTLRDNVLRNKILVENFTFLSMLQVSNLLLFIITIPYLFRVLGSQNYGLIIFAQTVAFYFSILINFGFNLTATRDVSVNRNNPVKISEIVSSVLILKFSFFIISFLLVFIITFTVEDLFAYRLLFLFSMAACLSDALFPVWYFQGIEKMKYITFINASTRILATILVFIIISEPGDYLLYPLILGTGTITGSLIGLGIVFINSSVKFRLQKINVLRVYFVDNVLYFLSNVSTQIYVNANKLIAGTFLGMVEVAYYDVAEKVVNLLKVPLSILGQTLFPKVAKDRNTKFLRKIMIYTVIGTMILVVSVFCFSGIIFRLFSGLDSSYATSILNVLVLSLLPISAGMFFGDLILVNFGLKVHYVKIRLLGLAVYLLLFAFLYIVNQINAVNLAWTMVAVELFISAYSYTVCLKEGLNIFGQCTI